ncbi:hypothetical protein L2E82_44950 [Cichorium intybus]|uniref:Uncharacterized protein n=1 Tax=Cichorium intybus TaxID=13427 RepID=A0ACB8ZRI9_CICIN|nr:hypothetical protein L2E82_44950 [Cichorium intybus]
MMSRASLPISFWGYALETAAHILNLVPTKKVSKTPHEMWSGKCPLLAHIKSTNEEPITDTSTQPEAETLVVPVDNSLPLCRSRRVSMPLEFYGFHITAEGDTFINDKTLPEGFEHAKYPNKVCKLEKSIYGLKQASCSWNLCFHEKVKEFGFSRSEDESCVYVKCSGSVVAFLVLYVDDILLIGNDIPTLEGVKAWLRKCFAMKDLGDATYILRIRIYKDRSKRLLGLSQST